MFAYGRAVATRPITATHRCLYLRSGLHWTGSTPLANVRSVLPYSKEQHKDALNISIGVKPNLTLEFTAPVLMLGLYWIEKETSKIALHVDEPKAFIAALIPEKPA